MIDIVTAIISLKPNASWQLNGDDYSGLEWLDQSQTKPTEAEVQAEIARLQTEYDAKEYQRKRAAEYPNFTDWLDGMVKGDQAQMDKYVADCLAIKQKYPKGVK